MSNINIDVLNQLADDIAAEDLRPVLAAFESDMQRLGAEMSVAASAGDLASYRRSAHAIAGAAGAVGAVTIERTARNASKIADSEQAAAVADAAAVEELVREAVSVLRQFVASKAPPA